MKSAEAYINDLQPPEFYFSQRGTTHLIELAKQIQLDAMREGMRRAAARLEERAIEMNSFILEIAVSDEAKAIFSTAEQLTEKDL